MANYVTNLLDKAKVIHNLSSDYKLAKALGIYLSGMTNYRKGKTLPNTQVLAKICLLTGDDLPVVVAEVEKLRASDAEVKAIWGTIAERLRNGALSAVFAVFILGFLPNGNNALAAQNASNFQVAKIYIVECVRRWLSWLPWLAARASACRNAFLTLGLSCRFPLRGAVFAQSQA
jgi:hypothetical protein